MARRGDAVCPTIDIDFEVYNWLQDQAVPFEDTPNSVLRQIAGLRDVERLKSPNAHSKTAWKISFHKRISVRRPPPNTGAQLIKNWETPIKQLSSRGWTKSRTLDGKLDKVE